MDKTNDRVSVSIGGKEGTNLHLSIQSDVPPTLSFEEYQTELFNRLLAHFGVLNAQMPKSSAQAQAPAYQAAAPVQAYTPAPANLGNCKHCGSANKWSSKKNKPYCSAMCWQKKE